MSNHFTSAAHEGATLPGTYRCWGCGAAMHVPAPGAYPRRRCTPCEVQGTLDARAARVQGWANDCRVPEYLVRALADRMGALWKPSQRTFSNAPLLWSTKGAPYWAEYVEFTAHYWHAEAAAMPSTMFARAVNGGAR